MGSNINPLYRLAHKDYFERFDAYCPNTSDFYDAVASALGPMWDIHRSGLWFQCQLSQNIMPLQGWKIHVSATAESANKVLEKVLRVLAAGGDANFKFAVDLSTLSLLNSKEWSRAGSGKFITIYPPNSRRFLSLIEELHQATRDLTGPYVLSDYRYKDSCVVFYRYGGMQLYEVLNVEGERTPMLVRPDGKEVPDQRLAYPFTPEWADELLPVNQDHTDQTSSVHLKEGRYTIEEAIHFSNSGGIYRAVDNDNGQKVIIKEARPGINGTKGGYDAVDLLKKEFSLLKLLADTRIAPLAMDLFQEWEHWFLVEEFIDGVSMSRHSATTNILLRTRATAQDCEDWYEKFRSISLSLISVVATLHHHNIVFADLSPNNLIVCRDKDELKLIDFESAYQIGVDPPAKIHTPGFTSPKCLAGMDATFDDDYYSLGAVLFAFILPVNGVLHMNPGAAEKIMKSIQADIGLPKDVVAMILNLLGQDTKSNLTPEKMYTQVQSCHSLERKTQKPVLSVDYSDVLSSIAAHMEANASYQRSDRLFPGDARLFTTNPLSIAYGASGVAYALKKITGNVPVLSVDWMLSRKLSRQTYAPGLYTGSSGFAWTLLELGYQKDAERIFKLTFDHPLLYSSTDLMYGAAGWGMTCLKFFMETGDEMYLDMAIEAGVQLLQRRKDDGRGCWWECSQPLRLGLAHGASGVGLFLLYLSLATNDQHFLYVGQRGLDFDLSFGMETKDGGCSWSASPQEPSPIYPYWRFGSAGIGKVALRFEMLQGQGKYRSILEKIFIDTDRKYAVLPGHFNGLAGIGDFLLDMHQFMGEERYLRSARKVAEGIMQFRVDRDGAAFPGDMLSRLSCDYGTGSAGIALFLKRLMSRQRTDFMLDPLMVFEPTALPGVVKGKGFHDVVWI